MKRFFDRFALVIGVVALLCAASCYYLFAEHRRAVVPARATGFVEAAAPYRPAGLMSGSERADSWNEPLVQTWDSRAIFEVFTPPIIFYNPRNGHFTLEPPLSRTDADLGFGLELVKVQRELYRLQYEGYAGDEDDYLALLRNEATGAGIRGRVGDRIEEEGFSIVSFDVNRSMVEQKGGTPVMEETVTLVIFDERADADIALGTEPRYNPRAEAVFRLPGAHDEEISLPAGESLEIDGDTFTVLEIDGQHEGVLVEKTSSRTGRVERERLMPGGAREPREEMGNIEGEAPPEVDPSDAFPFPF